MPAFLVISQHAPESCWMFNEKTRQIHLDLVRNLDSLLKKNNVTLLGCWFDLPGHTLYEVYDAPDAGAVQRMSMEPEIMRWASFNTMKIVSVSSMNEVMGLLQHPGPQT